MMGKLIQEVANYGINLVDIGSSGSLDDKWKPIEGLINLVGFDPNSEECARMNEIPHAFRSARYLPYAIAGTQGEARLFKTKSIYCYSLLEPNMKWLKRFSYYDLFEICGEQAIPVRTLDSLQELGGMDVDVIKCDTQGMELPILSHAGEALENAFYVETETGFVENYLGETTFSQIDEFMRSKGFLLFDLNTAHRIPRNNVFRSSPSGNEQILWCEAVWLKDYVSLLERDRMQVETINRDKAVKVLFLCALQGCSDFGYELAELFCRLGLLSKSELEALSRTRNWRIASSRRDLMGRLVNYGLRMLRAKTRYKIYRQAEKALQQGYLLRSLIEWMPLLRRPENTRRG